MSKLLEIRCFGGFQVWVDKRPLTQFYSQKARALLAYLAVAAGQTQSRSHLAGLLWPDYPEARARRNLSQTLTALRKDLGPAAALIHSTHRAIGLAAEDSLVVDVVAFEASLTAVRHHSHANLLTCSHCTQQLQKAASLYTGPLLQEFSAADSALFEQWLGARREQLAQQAIDLLTQLANNLAAQQEHRAALETVDRLLALVPWQESAHRQRMLLLAQQGRRTKALAQYELLCDALMSEFGVGPSTQTDALYDQILAGEFEGGAIRQVETAVSSPPAAPPYHAPSVAPHFVGRQTELDQIKQLLRGNGYKTSQIAIVGMGGVGKTAFAAYAAQQLKPQFANGVLWSNSKTSDVFNILDLWAKAYGNDFSGISDLDTKTIAVRDMFADKQVLVMIDNVEDAAAVRPLLPHSEHCVVMLTTRNLDIATTLNAKSIALSELEPDKSQQLLRRILGKARVEATPKEAAAAVKIGQLLHHLPLAVEIAAKRLQSRPRMRLAALAQRLESTQRRLGLEISDQAVRASFQVSWEGLTSVSKRLFAAMGVFAGRPFTVEALATIVDLDLFDTEDELFSLAALSLVNEEGETRYRQHPLLADFAAEKLAGNEKELAAHQQRLIAYYLSFTATVGGDYGRLEPEWEQITAVIQLAHQRQQWEEVLVFANSLTPAWKAYGHYSQARRTYQLAYEAAQKLGDKAQEALVLRRWGEASLEQNDYQIAKEKLRDSHNHFKYLEDGYGIAQTQYQLARVAIASNQYKEAAELLGNSGRIYKSLGDKLGQGHVFFQQGRLALRDFRLDAANFLAEKAFALFKEARNQVGLIETLHLLTHIASRNNNVERAEALALEARKLCLEIYEQALYASNLYILTGIYRQQEKLALAKDAGEKCLPILRQTGRRRTQGLLLRQLSLIHMQLENVAMAMRLANDSWKIFKSLEDIRAGAVALRQIGDLHQMQNQQELAREAWGRAATLARQANHESLLETIAQRLA